VVFALTLRKVLLNENNGKTLLAANEIKKWLGKRAQAGKIEPKSLHSKI
jgi:hypothetical protein